MKKFNNKMLAVLSIVVAVFALAVVVWFCAGHRQKTIVSQYKEERYSTPNFTPGVKNKVQGVVLHHTAGWDGAGTVKRFMKKGTKVSAHCVIDLDGKRYVLCSPETVAWHAGESVMKGHNRGCNFFTIGIEFVGNTCEKPLTEDQIKSGIEYLLPLIEKYHICTANIVTHKMVRDAYIKSHPNDTLVRTKADITNAEYNRFMKRLEEALQS